MRLIDADALEQELFDADWTLDNDEHMVQDIIEKQPTIDAVPVVRCVDCKYRCALVCPMYHTETYIGDLDGFDDDYEVDRTVDDGFCHLGERWEGEAE